MILSAQKTLSDLIFKWSKIYIFMNITYKLICIWCSSQAFWNKLFYFFFPALFRLIHISQVYVMITYIKLVKGIIKTSRVGLPCQSGLD